MDAVGVTRQRCWKYDWVLEFDIKGLFDNLPHDLLLKAVRKDVKCNWALLYIERWLTAPMEKNGEVIERSRGTPQGGVVSPILSNLFLHYAFDLWMTRTPRPSMVSMPTMVLFTARASNKPKPSRWS
nr:reverse transcriptase domain-containing protein [Sinorhizobium meliloti]